MSDYESSWLLGIISDLILWFLLTVAFWALSPAWFGFVAPITASITALGVFNQVAPIINNLTLAITTMFFALIGTVILHIIVLPFLRQPQQEAYG